MSTPKIEHHSPSGGVDSDYAWLKTHLNFVGSISRREETVRRISINLMERAENGRLPYTLGRGPRKPGTASEPH